ncbi:MAG: choice-of-anchor J domain-containing protein [Planctomycetota bacterium]|jgi:hypothetical protein
MRFAYLTILLLSASPLAAQTTILSEDFSGGTFPPLGWTEDRVGPNQNGWERASSARAWHEDFTGSTTENYLITPAMDLSGMTEVYLHFSGESYYTNYRANHPNSVGDGISDVQISTNGGLSWTVLWTDTSLNNNDTYSPTVDISTYAGLTNVQIAFYFYGTFAQEWWIDDVVVDDTPVPVLANIVNPNNGHPYFLLGESDFDTAQAMAISLGGSQRDLMIGLNDRSLEGTFTWISGEGELYRNWAAGEPNNGGAGGEDFVQITSNGQWNDFDGSGSFGVVEISEPRISTTPLQAGGLTTITVNGLRTDSTVILVFSVNGAGPTNTPYGVLEVDADMITPTFPSMGGQFNFSTYIPSNLAGRTLYGQGIQFNSDLTTDLSEAFAEVIQ